MKAEREDGMRRAIREIPWRKVVGVTWAAMFIAAIGILAASLPGYPRFISMPNLELADASPVYLNAMQGASGLASLGSALLCLLLAVVLFRRKRGEVMAVFASFFLLGYGIIMAGPLEALVAFQPERYTALVYGIQSALFTTPTMFIFALFPNGHYVPRWTRFAAIASLLYIPVGFYLRPDQLFNFKSPAAALGSFGYFALILTGLYAQVYRYRRVSTARERQQTKWFLYGLLLWMAVSTLSSIPFIILQNLPAGAALPWWSPISQLGWFLSLTILPLSFAIAIMRYRLWDIDFLISRTLVYGLLTVIIIGLYILLVGGFSQLFHTGGNLLISLITTGLIAVLFQPLRERLQRLASRLIYGERDDPVRVLTKLGERLEATVAPESTMAAIVESISQALRLPYAAITLKEGSEFVPAAEWGQKPAPSLACEPFPLNYQSEPVGQIIVSRRTGEDSFTPEEKSLLQNIARQVGPAAYAIQLTRDLQRSRERLVTAREEERRRLRRDLHDGLGPTLASLTLKLDAARNQLRQNPEETDSLLVDLKSQIQSAIEGIRRLAYNLRPPALDELGLLSAIQEYASNHLRTGLRVRIEHHGNFPRLPAAVEVAAYRIVCEALTNVSKHSQATESHVQFALNGVLQIDIQDNGSGLPEDVHAGVGMFSMRERAAELGGTLAIEPNPGGGVHITAHLPCEGVDDEL
jgi:signal transduction histidine kinase